MRIRQHRQRRTPTEGPTSQRGNNEPTKGEWGDDTGGSDEDEGKGGGGGGCSGRDPEQFREGERRVDRTKDGDRFRTGRVGRRETMSRAEMVRRMFVGDDAREIPRGKDEGR